jgi:hypothetical protein
MMPVEPLGEIRSYDDLIQCLRNRSDELAVSRETIDFIGGLPARYSNKVLGFKRTRRIGMQTLEGFLGALGVKLLMVVDEETLKRYSQRRAPRNASQVRVRRRSEIDSAA